MKPICAIGIVLMDGGKGIDVSPIPPDETNQFERLATHADITMMLAEAARYVEQQRLIGAFKADAQRKKVPAILTPGNGGMRR